MPAGLTQAQRSMCVPKKSALDCRMLQLLVLKTAFFDLPVPDYIRSFGPREGDLLGYNPKLMNNLKRNAEFLHKSWRSC